MPQKKISNRVVHEAPADLKKALTSAQQALTAWEDITPLARNEWICWIESAKLDFIQFPAGLVRRTRGKCMSGS